MYTLIQTAVELVQTFQLRCSVGATYKCQNDVIRVYKQQIHL